MSSELLDQEVISQISLVAGAMNPFNMSIWKCQYLCRVTKLRDFKVQTLRVLLNGSKTWILSHDLESSI